MNKFLLVIVFFGLVGGGYFHYQNSQKSNLVVMEDSVVGEAVVEGDNEVKKDDPMEENDFVAMVMESDGSLVGELEDVSGGSSNGVGYVLRGNGSLYHYVEARLPRLAEGLLYEGWLVSESPLEFFSTGVMEQVDDVFLLEYMSEDERLGFNKIVITLETKIDAIPEKHILEGVVR
jgi:hypothetical protein